ncbi:YlxM family DNA-binding protein [Gemelliphila palaticanis]|uniref:UPF0122 protein HZY85_03215 n=1 Tax=Gemelliphila palaticanis TaxID=81950 RepID=A0ABX2SYB6_9BACL|nr:sigma factor-like helix-turn-helix DNA-binding protein [Gemella palaticanis]MBF0715275.1 hypothetical protein [Gemella palaticanis]NYS47205.1 hypothetical protein [Gemella palaticanis]
MGIEKIIKISQLYDFYSELLNDKQREYIKNYYFDDLSLTEMSEIYGISKQAISNNIKRSVKDLEDFEEKLEMIKISNERQFLLNEINRINTNNEVSELLDQLMKLDN